MSLLRTYFQFHQVVVKICSPNIKLFQGCKAKTLQNESQIRQSCENRIGKIVQSMIHMTGREY